MPRYCMGDISTPKQTTDECEGESSLNFKSHVQLFQAVWVMLCGNSADCFSPDLSTVSQQLRFDARRMGVYLID